VPTKTAITEALRSVFNGDYPDPGFRGLNITIEFPMQPSNYPGIWIQFEETGPIRRVGIDHHENVLDSDGIAREVTRYWFNGNLVLTCAALSSQERDRLYDELVRVFAFSGIDSTSAGRFRTLIDHNDLIGLRFNYDELTGTGEGATPGTPWDTNEVIYERTLTVGLIGEFVLDTLTNILIPLSRVSVSGFNQASINSEDLAAIQIATLGNDDGYDPTQWT
jgi:hypothetical protein